MGYGPHLPSKRVSSPVPGYLFLFGGWEIKRTWKLWTLGGAVTSKLQQPVIQLGLLTGTLEVTILGLFSWASYSHSAKALLLSCAGKLHPVVLLEQCTPSPIQVCWCFGFSEQLQKLPTPWLTAGSIPLLCQLSLGLSADKCLENHQPWGSQKPTK